MNRQETVVVLVPLKPPPAPPLYLPRPEPAVDWGWMFLIGIAVFIIGILMAPCVVTYVPADGGAGSNIVGDRSGPTVGSSDTAPPRRERRVP